MAVMGIVVSYWLYLNKSYPLKLHLHMIYTLQMMYVRFSTKIPHFILIVQKRWPSWAILVF